MILNQGFPDVRVCQEANALTDNSFEVWIVVSSLKSRSPEFDAQNFNTIVIDTSLNKKRTTNEKLRSLVYNFPEIESRLFANPNFLSIKNRIVAVHVHDLHWCRFGYEVSKKLNAKFVVDFHENSPALPEYFEKNILTKNPRQLINNFFNNSKLLLSLYEKWAQKNADAIIVVTTENADRLNNRITSRSKVYCVSNTKDPNRYSYIGISEKPFFNIFYHGTIQPNRGLITLAKAFAKLDPRKFRLTILGFSHNDKQKKLITDLLTPAHLQSTELLDWTSDYEKIQCKVAEADIGIIPHNKLELTETTLPNKLFEYFCYGKPVIVSDVAPLKRVVEDAKAGLVFEAGNELSLANCITMMADKVTLRSYSIKAREAAEGKYSWNTDKSELVRLYSELATH
jgi:glycosyltransferase involved in cell wall biosynthesis